MMSSPVKLDLAAFEPDIVPVVINKFVFVKTNRSKIIHPLHMIRLDGILSISSQIVHNLDPITNSLRENMVILKHTMFVWVFLLLQTII